MPTLLDETEFGQTIRTDDGQVVTIPKGIADQGAFDQTSFASGPGGFETAPGGPGAPPPFAPPQPSTVGGVDGFAAPIVEPERPAAPAQDIGAALSAGPSVTVSNDYTGKGAAKRLAADQAAVASMGQPPPAPAAPEPQPVDAFQQAAGDEQAAYDQAIEAQMVKGDIEAQQADATAAILQQRQDNLDTIEKQRQRQAQADQAERARFEEKYNAAVDAEASWKMDRGRYWRTKDTGQKVGMLIGVLLSGIGAALDKKEGNAALTMLMQLADQDAADQMDEHDNLAKRIGITAAQADRFRSMAADRAGEFSLRKASALEAAAREVEVMASQYASPLAKANAVALAAGLRQEKASALGKAAEGAWGRNLQERQFAEQQAARRQAAAQAAARLKWDQQQFYMSREADIAAAQAAGEGKRAAALAEDTKDLQARGVFDPRTGRPMLQPEGEKMWQEAEALRAKGDAAGAAQIESQAIAQHALRTGDGKDVRKSMGSVQQAVTLADEVKREREKNGAAWLGTSEGEQYMDSKAAILGMVLKDTFQLGALDKGSLEVLKEMLGGKPSSIKLGDTPLGGVLGVGKGNRGSLDAVVDSLASKAQTDLRAVGYRGEWKPRREPTKAPVLTADEAGLKGAETSEAAFDGIRAMGMGDAYRGRDAWGAATVAPQAQAVIDATFQRAAAGDASARTVLEQAKLKGGGLGRAAEQALAKLDGFVTPSGFKASRVGSRLNADGTVTPPAGAVAAYPGAAR